MNEIEKLVRQYIKACFWYYVMSDPIMGDQEADMLFKELEKLEEKQGEANPRSPTQMIYGENLEQYPDWALVDKDIENLNAPKDMTLYGVVVKTKEPEEQTKQNDSDWEYTFKYIHDQIWHNPMLDRNGDPVLWHSRPRSLCGKRIRVFSDYQENWISTNNGIPVRKEYNDD